jgi:DNA repair photolyase
MYEWITHTWNTVKGECPHGCTYCYMKRFGKQKPMRFDENELSTDLGSGNFIFVGSSCDLFAADVPELWIRKTLKHCEQFDNRYLFQSKNPWRILDYIDATVITDKSVVCTTMETNRYYPEIMGASPVISDRVFAMHNISKVVKTYITIEPIMAFDLEKFVIELRECNPTQVNIGADSGNNNLPEPTYSEVMALIEELNKFTVVANKKNLNRLLK